LQHRATKETKDVERAFFANIKQKTKAKKQSNKITTKWVFQKEIDYVEYQSHMQNDKLPEVLDQYFTHKIKDHNPNNVKLKASLPQPYIVRLQTRGKKQ